LVVFNGRGHEVTAEITAFVGREVRLRKLHESRTAPLRCHITLAQAIPKGKTMEVIVQKAVEIGASEIAPIISDRTIVRLSGRDAAEKQAKWETIAIEAAKQSGQNWLPEIRSPRSMLEFFSGEAEASGAVLPGERQLTPPRLHSSEVRLIGSLQPDAVHMKSIFAEYSARDANPPSRVLMIIGPEGDFTLAELELARGYGCQPVTLGRIILRVETAAIYCLSVLSYELLS